MGCRGHFGPQAEFSGWNTDSKFNAGHTTFIWYLSTLQVKVFAWLPVGSQLFWFNRNTFLQIKSPALKF